MFGRHFGEGSIAFHSDSLVSRVVRREVDKYRFFYKPYFELFEPLSTNFAAQIAQTKDLQ